MFAHPEGVRPARLRLARLRLISHFVGTTLEGRCAFAGSPHNGGRDADSVRAQMLPASGRAAPKRREWHAPKHTPQGRRRQEVRFSDGRIQIRILGAAEFAARYAAEDDRSEVRFFGRFLR